MDAAKKKALDLIEVSVKKLPVAQRGHQLMAVVRDYIDDGDLKEARRVLARVDDAYYDCPPPAEKVYLDALARVVEVFGADLRLFCRPSFAA